MQCLCACSKSSSLFLVYLCGRITAPHTGRAFILHHFDSVSVFSFFSINDAKEKHIRLKHDLLNYIITMSFILIPLLKLVLEIVITCVMIT